jgi:uncharacterized protein
VKLLKINPGNILKADDAVIELDFSEMIEGLDNIYGDCEFTKPAQFKGQLTNMGGVLSLKGRLRAEYTVKCFRCLKEINSVIDTKIEEKYVNSENNVDSEAYTYEYNMIDITRALKDNIILALPVRQLCSANCKGLCPNCGANLNLQACNCRNDNVDARLEVLKNFFNKN